tara:strand:- start:351 stop:1349 length:999 start_codon:yes stop_codon:yes gene_type:complete
MLDSLITNNLPPNYGKVSSNRQSVPAPRSLGIVIPCYGRPEYLKKTLEALKLVDLGDAVIIIVDETNASMQLEGYVLLEDCEFKGDTWCGNAIAHPSSRDFVDFADNVQSIIGFNRFGGGTYKTSITGLTHRKHRNAYIKSEHAGAYAFVKPRTKETITSQLIESFDLENTPIVRIFKKNHANMFDSIKYGFDVLTSVFGCKYLMTLDSDATVLYKHSITTLLNIHMAFETINNYVISSGFNTAAHETISFAKFNDVEICVKKSMGGINMLLSHTLYKNMRHLLVVTGWDWLFVKYITEHKGLLLSTKKSLVQHIGLEGVWSGGGYCDTGEI